VNARPFIVAGTVAGVGTLGWVTFRLYVRSEVVRVLNTDYDFDRTVQTISKLKVIGFDMRLPTAEVFAESIVPIWSTIMPEAAIDDILAKGRSSAYWPEEYRKGATSAAIEPYLLAGLRKAGKLDDSATNKEQTTALLTGITEALVTSAYKKKR
jgi:hypothetical protein